MKYFLVLSFAGLCLGSAARGSTKYDDIKRQYDFAQKPRPDAHGWYGGRCYSSARPDLAVPALLFFYVDQSTDGPLFSKTKLGVSYCNSSCPQTVYDRPVDAFPDGYVDGVYEIADANYQTTETDTEFVGLTRDGSDSYQHALRQTADGYFVVKHTGRRLSESNDSWMAMCYFFYPSWLQGTSLER